MFYQSFSLLSGYARADALPSPRAPGALAEWTDANARLSMSRDLPAMKLSERLADPAAWRRQQLARRQALEALVSAAPDRAVLERAADLLCMICEESIWSENPQGMPFDDESRPEIDLQCAETAMLLAWTHRAFGERLPSRVTGKVVYEVRRRVFAPFLAHEDYPFMTGESPRPMGILCDILLCAVLLESDLARRAAILKAALRRLDQAVTERDARVEPLCDAAAETAALTDLCRLMHRCTRGRVNLTAQVPPADWLDQLVFPWMGGECFVDAATGDLRPPLSGAELFRIGLSADDDELAALGAMLHRLRSRPSQLITGRLLDMGCAAMLTAEPGRPQKVRHAATARNRVMISRMDHLACALHAGGGAGNAGALTLFYGDRPILVETPQERGVPRIAGRDQSPNIPCEAEYEVRRDREVMSVDLTRAYAVPGLRSCQRTAMIQRQEGVVRLVDMFELDSPANLLFCFLTPEKPQYLMNGLRLGPVDLTWEGDLTAGFAAADMKFPAGDASGSDLYRIELAAAPVKHAFFAFTFSPSRG